MYLIQMEPWSITWTILVSSLVFLPFSGSVRFTSNPPPNITALKGQGVWFPWQYTSDGRDINNYACGYFNATLNRLVPQVEGRSGFAILPGFNNKVIAYSANRTYALWNVDYSDSATYYCSILSSTGGSDFRTTKSDETKLTVEGKPEFCADPPVTSVVKKEGEDTSIAFTLCGVPAPTVEYRWMPSATVQSVSSTPVSPLTYRHTAKIPSTNVNRNRCGNTLAFKGKNARGETVERQTTYDIKFVPVPPENLNAYYTSNGNCVESSWDAQESGLCKISYRIDFINQTNGLVESKTGDNIVKSSHCNFGKNNVTAVNVTASTSEGSAFKYFRVVSTPPTQRSVRFTSNPPPSITALKGQGVWFPWQYSLDGRDINNYACGYFNATLHRLVPQVEGKFGFAVLPGFNNKVIAYSANRTYALWNVDYSDSATYYCSILSSTGGSDFRTTKSDETKLTVEGKPEFCAEPPVTSVVKKEGEDTSIAFTLCGVPAPTVEYRWMPSATVQSVSSTPVSPLTYRHTAKIPSTNVNRNRCGNTLAFKGKNARGETVERQIMYDIKFIPVPPENLNAYYTSNGNCVESSWDAQESGLCKISYKIDFINQTNGLVESKTGDNIVISSHCNFGKNNVTAVNVTASTPEGSAFKYFSIASTPPTQKPGPVGGNGDGGSNSSIWIIIGSVIGGIILITVIVIGIICGRRTGCKKINET